MDRAAKHYGRFTPIIFCSSTEFPLYAYVLSLELAALAMILVAVTKKETFIMYTIIKVMKDRFIPTILIEYVNGD